MSRRSNEIALQSRYVGTSLRLGTDSTPQDWIALPNGTRSALYLQLYLTCAGTLRRVVKYGSIVVELTAANTLSIYTPNATYTSSQVLATGWYSLAITASDSSAQLHLGTGFVLLTRTAVSNSAYFPNSACTIGYSGTTPQGGLVVSVFAEGWPATTDMGLRRFHNLGRGAAFTQMLPFPAGQSPALRYVCFDQPYLDRSTLSWKLRTAGLGTADSGAGAQYMRLSYDARYSDLTALYFDGANDVLQLRSSALTYGAAGATWLLTVNGLVVNGNREFMVRGNNEFYQSGGGIGYYSSVTGNNAWAPNNLPVGIAGSDYTVIGFTLKAGDAALSRLYCDGQTSAIVPPGAVETTAGPPVFISAQNASGTAASAGLRRDIQFWNRALTSAELAIIQGTANGKRKGAVPTVAQNATLNDQDPDLLIYITGQRGSPDDTYVPALRGQGGDLLNYTTNAPNLENILPTRLGTTLL